MAREGFISKDDRNKVVSDTVWGMSRGLFAVVAIIIVAAIIGAASWGISVATSDVRGSGDQIQLNNSNQNRTFQQQNFEDLYSNIKSLDRRIELTDKKIKADQEKGLDTSFDATNLSGLQNTCIAAVGTYNAAARKVLAEDWRSPDLPQQINDSNPETDCMSAVA